TTTMPNLQAEAHDVTRQQVEMWFCWMDRILDIHRANFVFRDPTPATLEEHRAGLKLAIRQSHLIYALIADPDFSEPVLVSRLNVRVRQLQDAYDTFHDRELSDEIAERILK